MSSRLTTTSSAGLLLCAGIIAAFGVLLLALAITPDPGGGEPTHLSEIVGLPLPYLGVAAVVVVALLMDRPLAFIAAGVALLPMSLISLAAVGLPLLVPGIYIVVTGLRGLDRGPLFGPALIPVVGLLLAGSFIALFATEDPTTWATGDSQGMSSDHISWHETAISAALACAAIVVTAVPLPRRVRRHTADA